MAKLVTFDEFLPKHNRDIITVVFLRYLFVAYPVYQAVDGLKSLWSYENNGPERQYSSLVISDSPLYGAS